MRAEQAPFGVLFAAGGLMGAAHSFHNLFASAEKLEAIYWSAPGVARAKAAGLGLLGVAVAAAGVSMIVSDG